MHVCFEWKLIDFDLFLKQTKQYYQLDLDVLHNLVKMVVHALIFHQQMHSYVRVVNHMKVFIVMRELECAKRMRVVPLAIKWKQFVEVFHRIVRFLIIVNVGKRSMTFLMSTLHRQIVIRTICTC
jgi:hypothetical protein